MHKQIDVEFGIEGSFWGEDCRDSDKHKLFPAKIVRVEERHEFGNARRSRKEAGLLAELAEEAADLVSDEPEDKLWMTLAEYSKHKGLWDSVQPKNVTPDAGGGGGADGADDDEEEIEADDDAQKVGSKSTLAAAVASQFKTRVFVQDITVKSKNSTGDVVKEKPSKRWRYPCKDPGDFNCGGKR